MKKKTYSITATEAATEAATTSNSNKKVNKQTTRTVTGQTMATTKDIDEDEEAITNTPRSSSSSSSSIIAIIKRTSRPTKMKQLHTLIKKQFKIDGNEKKSLFIRLVIGPIVFLLFTLSLRTGTGTDGSNGSNGNESIVVVGSAQTFQYEQINWTTIPDNDDNNNDNNDNDASYWQLVIGSSPSLQNNKNNNNNSNNNVQENFANELSIALGWKEEEAAAAAGKKTSNDTITTTATATDDDNVDDSNSNNNKNEVLVIPSSTENEFRIHCNDLSSTATTSTTTSTSTSTSATSASSSMNNSTQQQQQSSFFLGCIYLSDSTPDWKYVWMPPGDSLKSLYGSSSSSSSSPDLLVSTTTIDSLSILIEQNVIAVQNAIQNSILAIELQQQQQQSSSSSSTSTSTSTSTSNSSSSINYEYIQRQPIEYNDDNNNNNKLPSWGMLLVVGAYANIGIMFVLSLFAQLISEDIRIGLDRQFLLMGVPSTIYWFHYFIVYTIENIVTATLYTTISYMIFLSDCNFGLLLLNYIIAFSAISSLIVILPTFVKQPDAIQVVPYMLILGSIITWTIIIYLVKDPTNIIITLFSLLNPIWGMQQLLASYYSFSGAGLGIGVTTIMEWWECGAGPCFFAQIGNIVLYLGIIHYKNRPQRGTIPPASDEDKQSALTPSKYIQSIPAERNESDVAFSVTGLRKEFVIGGSGKTKKTIKAVNGLNMTVKKGEVYGFLGHNGAGKSSALSLLAGEMLPTSGEAVFHFDNHHDGTTTAESLLPIAQGHEEEIRSRLGFCPQHDILFPNLSCRQHLELFSRLKGGLAYEGQSEEDSIRTEVETRLDEINFPAVEDNDKPCGTLSGGMKRKVSLALALIGDPTVVFLDEPTSGMDPANRRSVWEMISKAKKGRSIVLTTHFMDEADILSDRIGIINGGKMVATGTSLFLKQNLGTGYRLTYEVCNGEIADQVRASIQTMIPSLDLISVAPSTNINGNQVFKYHVPQGLESRFSPLLRELSNLGCTGIEIEMTTLEDVFLKLGGENTSIDSDDDFDGNDNDNDRDSNDERVLQQPQEDQEMDDIWGDLGEKLSLNFIQKVWIAAKVNIIRKARNKQYLIFVVFLPIAYGLVGFGLSYLFERKAGTVISPGPIALSAAATGHPSPNFNPAVYGLVTPSVNIGDGVVWEEEVPTSPDDFLSPPTGTYFLGGPLNGTLMYNSSLTFSVPLLSGLLANYTLAEESPGTSILGYLAPLDYIDPSLLSLSYILVPIMISFGFMSATILVVDLLLLKTDKMYALFRSVGISRLQLRAGVALQSILINVLPFCTICVILAFALSSPLVGDGGRWLAFIMTLIGYAYAITPFSMMFEPMFKSYKAAKDWWNLISMSIQILPYVVYSVIFTPPMSQAKTETAHIVSSSLCIFPSFVLQKNLGFLQLTSFMPGDVTWSYVWSWNAGVWFGILMLFVMGSFFWAVVYWMTVRKETHQHGSLSPDVDITNDSDLVEERKRAFHQHDGIHIMDVVKHFPAKASSQILLNRSIKPTKDKLAVKGISIGVAPGELYALLGPNGAGKTTLESCIMQDISTDGGTISLGGRDTVSDVFKDADVGYCPQYDSIFKELRVGDHIKFVAEARGLDTKSNVRHRLHVDTIIRKLGLDSHLLKMAKALSGGYKRKLCLAMALIGHPSILIADEPSTGVDPVSRRSLWTVLKPSEEKRKLIDMPATLLSTHYMEEGDNLATRIGIQIDGQLVTSGSLTRLKEKYCQANFLEATFTQDAPDGADEALFCFLKQQEELEPQMRESLMGRVKIQIPVHSDKSVVQLATLFDLIETNKADLHIEFYNLCSQSLEQIFIDLCKLQEEEKMRAVVDEATS